MLCTMMWPLSLFQTRRSKAPSGRAMMKTKLMTKPWIRGAGSLSKEVLVAWEADLVV